MEKKIIYIDMDGVLVDLHSEFENWISSHQNIYHIYKHHLDRIPGIFRNPKPIEGAIESVNKLHESGKYDLFIATAAPWGNPESSADKRYWIERHFGNLFTKKMFITHRKDLLIGDYLIDDRVMNGAGQFKGELIKFGWNYEQKEWNEYPTWDDVVKKLL
jgi:5'-nucleotidase